MGWNRETLSKDLRDGNASAAICVIQFITYFVDKAKSWEELKCAVIHSMCVTFLGCNECSSSETLGKIISSPNRAGFLADTLLELTEVYPGGRSVEVWCCCCF